MKKHLFYIITLACIVLLAGCRKPTPEPKWDHLNVNIVIHVMDQSGGNLLDYRNLLGNILDNDMKIIYNGETFKFKDPYTRADEPLLPVMDGFRLHDYYQKAKFIFGEFSVDTKQYHNEPFTIDWGDGTKSDVTFDLYTTDNGDDQPTTHYATRVDGELNNEGSLTVEITAAGPNMVGKTPSGQ
jgi:hypothetical protein